MRVVSPLLLCSLLLVTALAPVFGGINQLEVDDDSSVQARSLIDFEVTSIEFGTGSSQSKMWSQPDGSIVEYVIKGQEIQIEVTFTQAGTSSQPAYADASLQIWHPVGFMIDEFTSNMTLSGQQSVVQQITWIPNMSHSVLDDQGYLTGGIRLLGMVDGGLADDSQDNNDLLRLMPVAIWQDSMDNGFCGDTDGDGINDCPNVPYANEPIWVGGGYEADGSLSSSPDTYGHWRMIDSDDSAEGEKHWRVAREDSDYASNRHDRLWWGWFTPFENCDDPGHGLGYGIQDLSLSEQYGSRFCKMNLRGFDYLSMQLVTNAWGQMANGDTVSIEADAASSVESFNYTDIGLSPIDYDWSMSIWNMTGIHQTGEYNLAFKFDSDSSQASGGIAIDSFLLFAIERVPQYTLDAVCDDPLPNAYLVVPAESKSLHCRITNNGYVDVTLRLYTEVSNKSWMYDYPIRIDSNNPVDHDNFVVTDVVRALETTDVWFNITIPDGAIVQEMMWYVDINDGTTNSTKATIGLPEVRGIPLSVQAAYSCKLEPETLAYPDATILPGDNATIPMLFKNTGNQIATWNLGASFADTSWGSENVEWYDDQGQMITSLDLAINEELELFAKILTPSQISPGIYQITLIASGRAPAQFMSTPMIEIEVPVLYDIEVMPFVSQYTAPADGVFRSIEVLLVNNGNSEEAFDLYLDANWRLGASLNTDRTLGITPFGGDSTFFLMLPMPYGLDPETYEIKIIAKSVSNPSFEQTKRVYLTIPETHLVEVEDLDMLEEVFRGGDSPRTVNWEVTNNGNVDDAFYIEFEHLPDVSAEAMNLVPESNAMRTPFIPAGGSYNITVTYSFGDDAFGDRSISLIATSKGAPSDGPTVSGTGTAEFHVGDQGWIVLLPPNDITISEKDNDIELTFTVKNDHPTNAQLVRTDVDRDSDLFFNIVNARIEQEDRDFVLDVNTTREIVVTLEVTDENLDSLAEDSMTFKLTLDVDSDIDKISRTVMVTLLRPVPLDDGPTAGEAAWLGGNILFLIAGLVAIVAILLVTFRTMRSATSPLEEISTLDDYEMSVTGGDWAPSHPPAPPLPSSDEVANSMYGGSKEIFEQPPPPLPQEEEIEEPVPEPVLETPSNEAPPLPETGLPEGWTMEQWAHYGQRWIDQQKN